MYPHSHVTTFANRSVEEFKRGNPIQNPAQIALALRCEYYNDEEEITEKLATLLEDPQAENLEALIIGAWRELIEAGQDSSHIIHALVDAKDKLSNLKAIFIGDIISEENEISWIAQSDITPILEAYPKLEVLQVRGGSGLKFSPCRHETLKTLIIETGGLGGQQVREILALELPALEHLEIWLGSEWYGGDSTVEDLRAILQDNRYPNLTYLGLRNAEYTDEIAQAVAQSPIIEQIKTLDLSMGTLGEAGAIELLNCSAIQQLETLNLSENYLSETVIEEFSRLPIHVIADQQKEEEIEEDEEDARYCSVSE